MPLTARRKYGDKGEDYALEFLKTKGYKIVDRNYSSRFGEIDIIAVDDDTLVFVEVKTRWSNKFGRPEEAVTKSKLDKIIKTGGLYMKEKKIDMNVKQRVDVVAIDAPGKKIKSVRLIKNL